MFVKSPLGAAPEYMPNQVVDSPFLDSRASVMSWEEVGGPADQEVPMDAQYHKKSGSMSAKIGRNIRSAMRKRSQSRSSITDSSPPTSPRTFTSAIQSFSRRGSQSSASPSMASVSKFTDRPVRHQASISSLSPSMSGQLESSPNSLLLQHQLSTEPSPVGYVPRAELSDPRIHSSKLSPFPGMANLGTVNGGPPKLLHQTSDSVVPSQQRVSPAAQNPESIYSLPLPVANAGSNAESKRGSDDSTGKRSWLAKAFGHSSPRSSGSTSRKSSVAEVTGMNQDSDPFAAPPLPSVSRHRSASPTCSVVHEVSEEGSRLTRFTNRVEASPLIEEDEAEPLPEKSVDVLNRMDDLLALSADDPARPDMLDDPPRKMVLATQILQVVNVHVGGIWRLPADV